MKRWRIGLCGSFMALLLAGGMPATAGEERVVHFNQLNEAGGFTDDCGNHYTIKLSIWDMANSHEQAIAGLRKAADDRTVLAVLGSTPSTGFAAMEPVAGQIKMPVIATGSAVPLQKWNPYAFRVTIATPVAAPYFLKAMQEKFHPKRVALIYDITQDALKAEANLIRDTASQYGFELVAFEAFRVNDTDFRAQLTT